MIRKFTVRDLNHQELSSNKTGEKFSLSAVLTDELGFKDMFVHHEIIPPGRRSSGTHFHTRREEMVLVIQGHVKAWCEGTEVVLGAGDFVGFLPGKGTAHYVRNDGDQPASVLFIASNPGDDQVEYV